MKLRQYLKEINQSVRFFAKSCGLSEAKISFAVEGVREIPLETALIIQKISNGDVTLNDLCKEEFLQKLSKMQSPFKKLGK